MTFGSIVTVPNLTQIGRVEPYISVETFKDDPLSNSLDLSQLVEGGSQSAQDSAIYRMILRASAKIDNHTCGPTGTLNATQVTKQGQSFVNREGCVTVNPGEPRLIGCVGAEWGYQMGAWSQIPVDAYHMWVEETTIRLKIAGGAGTIQYAGIGDLSALFQGRTSGKVYVNYTYIAGWPNSFTSIATSTAGGYTQTVVGETHTVPATSPYTVTVAQAATWYADVSVTTTAGASLVGQYAVINGTYTFQAALHGTAVLISYQYGAPPLDLAQAVTEIIAERYRTRGWIGLRSVAQPGVGTTSYASWAMSPANQMIVESYRTRFIV